MKGPPDQPRLAGFDLAVASGGSSPGNPVVPLSVINHPLEGGAECPPIPPGLVAQQTGARDPSAAASRATHFKQVPEMIGHLRGGGGE